MRRGTEMPVGFNRAVRSLDKGRLSSCNPADRASANSG
ncbi:protein of unassigned function [Methylobacterium oryzae CBMB20]|uniref:Protein of unassigned function n=1 Tax=Methylobacterium oryzae CBMB20 TaxID=693986 RepID=A0A089P1D7_9HYPH|nr:protein of unassigned function [Methylobacterium oryzae CBMB20]